MAISTQNFCIREYAAKMRSGDSRRSWPFDMEADGDPRLPAISVRRFKWWGDELDSLRSAAVVEEEKRISGNRLKQKLPKKRSIVELFAASPLIVGKVEEKEMSENVVKKKKKKKKRIKEKICKLKMISSVQSYMYQNPVCSKKNRKTARSFVESQKQPAKEKVVRKKHTVSRTSKLLPGKQEVAKKLPVRSILKKQKRGTTDRKSSKQANAKAANLIKFYCKPNRHVTFSVKDDVVGNSRACSSMDFPQLQNLCKIFSNVLAASSAMNHSSKSPDLPDANEKPHEVNACEKGTHSTVVSRMETSSTEKNQSSDSIVNLCQPTVVNSSNSSCSGAEKAPCAVMVDLNHAIAADDIDCGIPATSTLSSSCIYSGDPNSSVTFHEKNPNSTSDIHLEACLIRSLEPRLVPAPNGEFVAGSNVASSMKLQKNPNSHSPSLLDYNKTNEKQYQPYVYADVNLCRQIEEHQSGGHRLLCHSMGSKKFGESLVTPNYVSTSKGKCPGEDFVGLPLNSHGELIQFHSGTKFSEAYNKQNMEWGSIHGFSANRQVESNGRMNPVELKRKKFTGAESYQKKQSDWNQKKCYSTRERVRHWLNFTEFDRSGRLEIQKNEPIKGKDTFLHCNSNQRSHSFHEYRNSNATHDFCGMVDYHSQPAAQPTVRLMGKNVVVSGTNRDYNSFNDGRAWNQNENLAEQTRFAMSENFLSQQWMQRDCVSHPTIGRLKGNLPDLLDSPPNFYHMKALEPTLDHMSITQQPQWPSRSIDSTIVNQSFEMDMNKHALPPQTFMAKESQYLGNCMPGESSISTGHHFPTIRASHPQNFHHHKLLSSSLREHNQRASTSQSQFKYPDFENFSQPPLSQPAAKLPEWFLHAKHQKRSQLPDSHYFDPNAFNQPCNVSGTYSNYHLSPYHVPMIPFSSRGDADPHKTRHRPFVSNAPSTSSNGDVYNRNIGMKQKEKEVIYSKSTSFKNPADAQKFIKRPADFDDGMINCAKRQPKGTEQLNEETSLELQNTANEKGSCRTANSSSSLMLGSESRSGPTKLIAGAKHILKPCQRMDEENCRPIHSTIIFPTTDASGRSSK